MTLAAALPAPSHLSARDLVFLSAGVFRTRRLRSALAVLGIAMGVASLISVLGISASSRAGLIAELDKLGTNLLQVQANPAVPGVAPTLPFAATPMLRRVGPVLDASQLEQLPLAVYRSEQMPAYDTNGINVYTTSLDLVQTLKGGLSSGTFLNGATARFPVVVLGATTAEVLGIDAATPRLQIWLGGLRFAVAGILKPLPLAPELDSSALIGEHTGSGLFHADGHATTIYVRTNPDQVSATQAILGASANPEHPEEVQVTRPSDALAARAAAKSALTSLFLALGVVALVVGGIGIANVMVIGVVERRAEIGIRRSLGATQGHICGQFLSESLMLGAIGGVVGVAIGVAITTAFAITRHWQIIVPPAALGAGLVASLLIAAVAGLYPALRAASLAPVEALRA